MMWHMKMLIKIRFFAWVGVGQYVRIFSNFTSIQSNQDDDKIDRKHFS